jgi:hypothetical protein
MKIRILLIALLVYALYALNKSIKNPSTPLPTRHVHQTTFFALSTASAVNILCAAGAYATKAVPRGMESDACMPYSMVAVGLAARLHIFHMGGYRMGEWGYVRNTPARWRVWAEGVPGTILSEVKGFLSGLAGDKVEGGERVEL